MTILRHGSHSAPPDAPLPPSPLSRYAHLIAEELQRALAEGDSPLFIMLRYHMGRADREGMPVDGPRGKGLRPTLCLFAAEGVGGEVSRALPAAAAVELIHGFSLIHDDIQDEDTERHHRPTVWAVWGKPQAITAGDAMRALADRHLLRLSERGLPPALTLEATRLLTERSLEMIQGQVLDLTFERRLDVSVDEYLTMISLKTGALIGASMELGALAGGADDATAGLLGQCGRLLGLTFQLRDDVLGVWGDSQQTGKPVGADIRQRKKAFPALFALQHAQGGDAEALRSIYASDEVMTEEHVARTLEIMERVGAEKAAQRLAEEKRDEALALAQQAPLSPWASRELEALGDFLLNRLN